MKHILFILLLFSAYVVTGQVLPAENSLLNYRLAGFAVPEAPRAVAYSFEIAEGTHTDEKSFNEYRIKKLHSKENKLIAELPRFGSAYTWRVIYLNKRNKPRGKTALYHFSTATAPYIDSSQHRLRILDTATAYKDLLVILDSRVMYDMKGNPVWFLPDVPGKLNTNEIPRDLKPTAEGTFTFLKDNTAFEVDYNGRILWEAPFVEPVTDSQKAFHHEFTRLGKNRYMILGQETINTAGSNEDPYPLVFGLVIELDSNGNVLWKWSTASYFMNALDYKADDGRLHTGPHLNAFFFNESKNEIYLSFRNTSNILKIEYPTGKILADYRGKEYQFETQHSCRLNKKGQLYFFNNNVDKRTRPKDGVSTLVIASEQNNRLTKLWEFPCNIDTETTPSSHGGGSVYELPGESILACMGVAGRVFIASPDKTVIWNAIPEHILDSQWRVNPQYRASYIPSAASLAPFLFR